jgi:hypothetical protein
MKKRDKKAVERPFTDFDPNKKLRKGMRCVQLSLSLK